MANSAHSLRIMSLALISNITWIHNPDILQNMSIIKDSHCACICPPGHSFAGVSRAPGVWKGWYLLGPMKGRKGDCKAPVSIEQLRTLRIRRIEETHSVRQKGSR